MKKVIYSLTLAAMLTSNHVSAVFEDKFEADEEKYLIFAQKAISMNTITARFGSDDYCDWSQFNLNDPTEAKKLDKLWTVLSNFLQDKINDLKPQMRAAIGTSNYDVIVNDIGVR